MVFVRTCGCGGAGQWYLLGVRELRGLEDRIC